MKYLITFFVVFVATFAVAKVPAPNYAGARLLNAPVGICCVNQLVPPSPRPVVPAKPVVPLDVVDGYCCIHTVVPPTTSRTVMVRK
jgi:hypothetical protein